MTQAVTPEQAVLGSALIRQSAYVEAALLLSAGDFETGPDRAVFEAMAAVAGRGGAIDPLTVGDELAARGEKLTVVGGAPAYLNQIANAVPHAENVRHYAGIVAKRAALRRLKLALAQVGESAEDDQETAQRLLLEAQRLVTEVQKGRSRPGVDLVDIAGGVRDEIEARQTARSGGGSRLAGLSTGITALDYITGGLRRGTLNIIAARTSLGKTSYACQLALLGAIHHKVPALFFSLEMRAHELAERFFSRLAKVNSERLRTGELTKDDWVSLNFAADQMRAQRGLVTISNTRNLGGIMTEARAFRVANPERDVLLVVDYLQIVTLGQRGRSREQEVAEISTALKNLAIELDCPVVAPVQFNRAPEAEDREPKLSDIRESGAIENDADLVVFIMRKRDSRSTDCVMKVAKHRNGKTGEADVEWLGATYELRDIQRTGGWQS